MRKMKVKLAIIGVGILGFFVIMECAIVPIWINDTTGFIMAGFFGLIELILIVVLVVFITISFFDKYRNKKPRPIRGSHKVSAIDGFGNRNIRESMYYIERYGLGRNADNKREKRYLG